jgi:Transposase DDE domain group 1
LQDRVGHLLKRPVGRPPHEVRRFYASFGYQAQSWKKPRRVVAKIVLACNLGNLMRTLTLAKAAEPWSLSGLKEKLIKIGAKVVSHGRDVTFRLAEGAVSRQMFARYPVVDRPSAVPAGADMKGMEVGCGR